ncbi:class I SAM-dependent methyltransferase [candidate division KSB1 bacterium]|nr:class I SAM-dependent methyltransferase [candidate division KSB1 bacterium]
MNTLMTPKVANMLDQLHREADEQMPSVRAAVKQIGIEQTSEEWPSDWAERMSDFYLPVSREQGRFLYQTVRATKAQYVVEFGTSFGISAIYIAAALHDNQGGKLVSAELIESKAVRAKSHLHNAGLSDYVDIRIGDALETLRDPEKPIDMLFLDGGPSLYLSVLKLLQPHLREGALVLADNVPTTKNETSPYAEYVRNPTNGYISTSIEMKGGTEYSLWTGAHQS